MITDSVIGCMQQSGVLNIVSGLSNITTTLQHAVEDQILDSANFKLQLQTLEILITQIDLNEDRQPVEFSDIVTFENIVKNVCLPALKQIHPSFDSRRENYVLISKICSVLVLSLKFTKSETVCDVLKLCSDSLSNEKLSTTDRTSTQDNVLDVQCALEIIRNYLNIYHPVRLTTEQNNSEDSLLLRAEFDEIFSKLLDIIFHSDNVIVVKMSLGCVSLFLKLNCDMVSERLMSCWEIILKIWTDEGNSYKPHMVLCGLANYFFPLDKGITDFDLRQKKIFWKIVQSGISNCNTLVRKQSVYLIKRIVDMCETCGDCIQCDLDDDCKNPVFWWKEGKQSQLSKVWEDFILLIETLEEKQVHVIKPLLPRMHSLVQAASDTESPYLHTSWLIAVLKLAFLHESIFLQRWAVDFILSLDFQTCPFIKQKQDKYFSGEFLLCLQEPKLYIRPLGSPLGSSPECAVRLIKFFTNCYTAYPDIESRASFVSDILETVCSATWGPAPLLFICQALSHIPKASLLDKPGVLNLRKIVGANISTVTPFVRGAVQCFSAQTLLNLIDLEKVSVIDFIPILAVFNHGESLQRGTTLWNEFVGWLQQIVKLNSETWSKDFITKTIDSFIINYLKVESESHYTPSETDTLQIARILLLSADAGVLPTDTLPMATDEEKMVPTLTLLIGHMTEVICSVNVRAYMSPVKAQKAIELLLCIYEELGKSDNDVTILIQDAVKKCLHEMLTFIQRLLTSDWKQMDDLCSIDLSSRVVSLAYKNHAFKDLKNIVKASVRVLNHYCSLSEFSLEGQIKIIGAGSLLSSIAAVLTSQSSDQCPDLITEICNYVNIMDISSTFKRPQTYDSQKEWGRITSRFMTNQWQLIYLCLNTGSTLRQSSEELLDMCFECLSVGSGETISPLFRCIRCLLPQVLVAGNTQKVVQALQVTWSCVDEVRRKVAFWDLLEDFVCLAYQPALLSLPEDSEVTVKLLQYADIILTEGEERSGMTNVLVSQLVKVWRLEGIIQHATKYYSVIVEACTYGILKKKERQINDVCAYITTLGSKCSVNELIPNIASSDIMVRVTITNFLCELKPSVPSHWEFVTGLLRKLTEKYRYVMKTFSGHTFVNMHSHRLRERTQQIIIILEPFITQENCQEMWKFAWECLTQEPQPSVRHMLEWLVLFLASKNQKFVNDLWTLFSGVSEKKNFTVCSLMSVLSHLGPYLPTSDQVKYYNRIIPQVLPWCMVHHFNTRVHAQALLRKLWNQCENLELHDVLKNHTLIKTCLGFNMNNKATKLVQKLSQNYFFGTFDFKRDYSMETIFYTLPRLSEYSDDEWISPKVFQITSPESWSTSQLSSFIPLYNSNAELANSDAGPWRMKFSVTDSSTDGGDDEDDQDVTHVDVQKKIIPWRMMTPDDETIDELLNTKNIQKTEGLILVTSLIDKVPNLGGLCRTSEIFGVSEFVIGKLKYLEDKMFQSLSVTAHKWIPITEVYNERLPEFLQQKRQEGYTLVGVEQTANSVSLTDFNFPVKTLLLLGNEKEGIPVDLINMLDVCVEIPQQGVIRSLNVHVSGALLVWEYRRQHLIKQTS